MSHDPDAVVKGLLDAAREGPTPEDIARVRARLAPVLTPAPSAAASASGLGGAALVVGSLAALGVAAFFVLRAPPPARRTDRHPVHEEAAPATSVPAVPEQPSAVELPLLPAAPQKIRPRPRPAAPESSAPIVEAVPAPALPATVAPAAPAPQGPDEVTLLREAQDLVRASPSASLARVVEHERRFPAGVLVQEREVIAVEALVNAGRAAEARARADRFLARYPRSALRRKVEELVGR